MKPLSYARRASRWLMAAGIAVATLMPAVPAVAEDAIPLKDNKAQLEQPKPLDETPMAIANPDIKLKLEDPRSVNPQPTEIVPFFTKKGRQRGCDYVEYNLRFGARGDAEKLQSPGFGDDLKKLKMSFRDQLPAGLQIVTFQVSGDGTDPSGGALPAGAIGTTANPGDTATVDDFRLSNTDIDGSGEPNQRYIDFRIVAKIDHAAFPAPVVIDNQGRIKVMRGNGSSAEILSQDPGKPDDGNFATGVKTAITIDLTRCDRPPPPPPGDRECFKVETGTVDCVRGGGAFIYHMPVGAEMAGKWVQLSTTNPGVTIDPDAQLVPAGGGVLDWKITGASPGDVVHIIVSGIETYAGPKEGVGLCCRQTIDIVIPPDLRCPPEKQPDLKVEKRADVTRCTMGGGCDFTITVTNVGSAPYNGLIVLNEVTLPAGSALSSGPNPPWVCAPGVSPLTCTHPATTLNPGGSVDLKLGFTPAGGWQGKIFRNCARYDYQKSGKPIFGRTDNDRACAEIPICRRGDRECDPPVEKRADIGIRKVALTPTCWASGVCNWRIDVINTGTTTITGTLTVIDTYPSGIPASSQFGPTPPWGCVPDGPGQFKCQIAGVNLVPGASIPLFVRTITGEAFTRDQIENCAEVKPVPGETTLANNKACAKARVPHRDNGKPAMRITKTCGGTLAGAASVSCRITVTNVGTAAPTGPVRVNDASTLIGSGTAVNIQTVTPDGAEWSCTPVPAPGLSCQIPGAVMTPGTSRHFDVTVATARAFENCARGSYGPAPGDDIVYPIGEACAKGGGQSTIRVEKTGDAECRLGQPCTFQITIANDGAEPFSGPVRIGDAIGVDGLGRLEGVAITGISPPFGCSPEPATLPLSCIANLTLGAGESHVHQVTVIIPDDGRLTNLQGNVSGQNCIAVLSPDTPVINGGELRALTNVQGDGGKAYACHPFTISREVKKECSQGLVLNDAGKCACPDGMTYRNGQCTGRTVDPTPPPPTKQCVLLKGQIRTEDGRCVCRGDSELVNGKCVVTEQPPVRQCKLLPGQIRTQDGKCVCRGESKLVNGQCVFIDDKPPVRQCKLLPGQIRTQDGKCVCPRRTHLEGGQCVRDKPVVQQCPIDGQFRNKRGDCVCPKGTEVNDGACRKIVRDCPKGTQRIGRQCVPVRIIDPGVRRLCPEGTRGLYPDCVPIRRKPTLEINPGLLNPDVLQQLLPRRQRQQQDPAGQGQILKRRTFDQGDTNFKP